MDNKSLLEEFETITDELIALDINGDIDRIIAQIEDKLSKRELIVKKIEKEEKNLEISEMLGRIMEKDGQLKIKFAKIKLSISDSITKVVDEKSLSSIKKKAHRGYMNVGKQNDGYFIDKKK